MKLKRQIPSDCASLITFLICLPFRSHEDRRPISNVSSTLINEVAFFKKFRQICARVASEKSSKALITGREIQNTKRNEKKKKKSIEIPYFRAIDILE
jgi:hypothetical protein